MASPADPQHPLTPPAEATQSSTQPSNQSQAQATSPSASQNAPASAGSAARAEVLLSQPLTSLDDTGASKRPRDHRLIHLLLASHGISAYQERVPIQLMDFAYRYTSSVLSDALHIQIEGYDQAEGAAAGAAAGGSSGAGASGSGTGKGAGGRKGTQNKSNEDGDVTLSALRFSIASRMGYSFNGNLPKEFLKNLADEKNRVNLATHARDGERGGAIVGGVKLPHERYCLTGVGWGLKEMWESEGEESADEHGSGVNGTATQNGSGAGDSMQVDAGGDGDAMDEDEEGMGTMEDVFGPDGGGGGSGGDGGDAIMQDS